MSEAFLIHEGVLYFACSSPLSIDTPVSVLIHGIWARYPACALSMLRQRIHACYPLSPVCEGAIKVAAKRASVLDPPAYKELKTRLMAEHASPAVEITLPGGTAGVLTHSELRELKDRAMAGWDAVSSVASGTHGHVWTRAHAQRVLEPLLSRSTAVKPVAAVLIGPEGGLLGASWNTSSTDKSAHAEYNLVRGFLLSGRMIPASSTLLVSLRPCALCAGTIMAASEDIGQIRIRFLEEDPGPASKNSCLMAHSDLWRRAGSPAVDVAWLSVP